MHTRRKLVVGNWKMNGSLAALKELGPIAEAARGASGVDVAICPPFTLISPAVTRALGMPVGAQDCHAAESGAHTGCVSVAMLKEAGARLAIVGHSERRADQHETDAEVCAKAEAALAGGLIAIVCVGESEAQREAGEHLAVVAAQLAGSLPDSWSDGELAVAYEPIWAIGTGLTATPQQAQDACAFVRALVGDKAPAAADVVRVLYGGSVKADNAGELIGQADIDGALVGGASLDAESFAGIIEAARA